MRHGLLVRLKYFEVVSVFTAKSKRYSRGLVVRVVQKKSIIFVLLSIYIYIYLFMLKDQCVVDHRMIVQI